MADSLDELREAVTRLKQECSGFLLLLRETYLEEQDGFRTTLPIGLAVKRKDRPIPTVPVATSFPFTSGEVLHPEGELWGVNLSTGNAVVLDPRRYPAAHMLIVAATRSGKSYTFKVLATQALLRTGEDVIIIDPSPPIDYQRWTEALGGAYVRLGIGTEHRINPCEILAPLDMRRVDEEQRKPVT